MDDHLCKPYSRDQLSANIKRWKPGRTVYEKSPSPYRAPFEKEGLKGHEEKSSYTTLDQKVLKNLRDLEQKSDSDLLARLIEIYFETSKKHMQSLREAIDNEDSATLSQTAHTFKSSNGNMGALTLAALCKQLDEIGRSKMDHGAREVLSQVEIEYEAVREALNRELQNV